MEIRWLCNGCGHDGFGQHAPDRCPHCGSFDLNAKALAESAESDANFHRRLHEQIEEYVRRFGHAPDGLHIED